MADDKPPPDFMSALGTEYFVLQSTASSTIPAKSAALSGAGADHVLIDDGQVAGQVRQFFPDGADAALEFVGTPTLPDTLRSVRVRGVGRRLCPGVRR